MRRFASAFPATATVLALAGCGGGPGVSTQPLQPRITLAAEDDGTLTVGDLRQELLAFADRAMGEMVRASESALATDSAPGTRAYVRALQADVASTSVALAVEPDPEQALLDLMVTMAAHSESVGPAAPETMRPEARATLERSLTRLEGGIWEVGARVYPSAELAGLRSRLEMWRRAEGVKQPSGVVRVAHLPIDAGPALSKGLLAPLDEANRQIEESRLLGERFLFLAERLPMISLWQAEAMTLDLMASPESRQALDGLTLMSETLEQLVLRVDSLPTTLDAQREAFLSAFDEREGRVRGLMDDAGVVLRDAGALAESGERVAALSTEAAAGLNETLASAERLVASLRDTDAPGGAMSFDVESYAAALEDFRAATETLSAALERAEGLAGTPRDVIDHAAWRGAQLIVLTFLLLAAYRFGPALVKGRRGVQG
jgi:hypothetical protein